MGKILIIANWLCLTVASADISADRPLRFLAYLPVVLIYLGALIDNQVHLNRRLLFVPFLYVALVVVTILVGADIEFYFIRDILILLSGIMTFLVVFPFDSSDVKLLFILFVLNVFSNGLVHGQLFITDASASALFDSLKSEGGIESSYSLSMGIFAIYFLLRKEWMWTLMACLAVVATLKRVSLGGVAAVIMIHCAVKLFEKWLSLRTAVAIVAVASMLAGLVFAQNASLVITSIFFWMNPEDRSIDIYLLGRYEFMSIITTSFQESSLAAWIFGHGPGSAQQLVGTAIGVVMEPHNDHLKIAYEYGLLGSLGVYFCILRLFQRNILGLYLFIYQMILFCTDNTLIYYFHWFACWVAINAFDSPHRVRAVSAGLFSSADIEEPLGIPGGENV